MIVRKGEHMPSASHSASPIREPESSHLVRRIISVVFGLVAMGFAVLLWVSREHIPDDWEAGFGWMYVIQGLLVVGFGAGAVTLWFPKDRQGLGRRIVLGAVGTAVVIVGIIVLLAID
mgnify:CR=1 FL=1